MGKLKQANGMPYFAQISKWISYSSTATYQNKRLLEAVRRFYVLYTWCVFYDIINFFIYILNNIEMQFEISIVKECRNIFAQIFAKSNVFAPPEPPARARHHCQPSLYFIFLGRSLAIWNLEYVLVVCFFCFFVWFGLCSGDATHWTQHCTHCSR